MKNSTTTTFNGSLMNLDQVTSMMNHHWIDYLIVMEDLPLYSLESNPGTTYVRVQDLFVAEKLFGNPTHCPIKTLECLVSQLILIPQSMVNKISGDRWQIRVACQLISYLQK